MPEFKAHVNHWYSDVNWVDGAGDTRRLVYSSPINSLPSVESLEEYMRFRLKEGWRPKEEALAEEDPYILDLADEYVRMRATARNRPRHELKKMVERLIPYVRNIRVSMITQRTVDRISAVMQEEGRAATTINQYLRLLCDLRRCAQEWGMCGRPDGPLPKPKRLKAAPRKSYHLTHEQTALVLNDLRRRGKVMLHDIVLLISKVGMRVAEVQALMWEDVSLDSRTLLVNKSMERGGEIKRTKTSRERSLPFGDSIYTMLHLRAYDTSRQGRDGLVRRSKLVFSNRKGRHFDLRTALRQLHLTLKLTGLDQIIPEGQRGFHLFRHTCASQMVSEGVNIRVIQECLGHASIQTTQRYAHVSDSALRKALEQHDSGIQNAPSSPTEGPWKSNHSSDPVQ